MISRRAPGCAPGDAGSVSELPAGPALAGTLTPVELRAGQPLFGVNADQEPGI
jgi:hypothetical protein